jgi:hypothetical protein
MRQRVESLAELSGITLIEPVEVDAQRLLDLTDFRLHDKVLPGGAVHAALYADRRCL